MLYLYSSVVDEPQLNMFLVKPNRFRFLFWNRFGFFELSSNDKMVATGARKCFVCGSMKNGVSYRVDSDVFFYAPECRGWEFFAGVKGRPLIGSRAEALPSELSLRQFVLGITCRKRKVMQLRCGCRRVQKRRKDE